MKVTCELESLASCQFHTVKKSGCSSLREVWRLDLLFLSRASLCRSARCLALRWRVIVRHCDFVLCLLVWRSLSRFGKLNRFEDRELNFGDEWAGCSKDIKLLWRQTLLAMGYPGVNEILQNVSCSQCWTTLYSMAVLTNISMKFAEKFKRPHALQLLDWRESPSLSWEGLFPATKFII